MSYGYGSSSSDHQDREFLLTWLYQKIGASSYNSMLEDYGEDKLVEWAKIFRTNEVEPGSSVASPPKQNKLDQLRQHMGDAQYQSALNNLGQAELEKIAEKMFGRSSSRSSVYSTGSSSVRTRTSSQKLNQIILFVALAYGALIGGAYPDWVGFGQVFDSIFYWVLGAVFVIGLIMVFILRTGFDFGNIWLLGLMIAALISSVVGLGFNLFTIGIKVIGVAGIAFIGCYLAGALLARPVYRLLERLDKTWMKWVFGILAVILAIVIMVIGWSGVIAIFPVK